jgi:hypothetical protein
MQLDVAVLLVHYRQSYDHDDHNTDVWLSRGQCMAYNCYQKHIRLTPVRH